MKKTALFLSIIILSVSIAACSSSKEAYSKEASVESTIESSVATPTPTPTPTPSPTPTPIPKLLKTIKYEVVGSDRMKIEEVEYDDYGNVEKVFTYSTHGGSEYYYSYDEEGNKTSSEYHSTYENLETNNKVQYGKNEITTYSYSESYYNGEPSTSSELEPVYENDVLVGLTGYYYSYGSTFDETVDYTYDEQGRLIQKVDKTDTFNTYTTQYSYDDEGNLLSQVATTDDGITQSSTRYTYSENGRVMVEVHNWYEMPMSLYGVGKYHTETTKNEYDNNGLLVKYTTEYSCDGSSYTDLTICEYDENGNLTRSETDTQKNGFDETIIYEYENIYE